ncbi:MAG TPA: hypothetical protein VJB57_08840 [Dehalococcoidia bacterium]|nr:hypothetical protein [Dehalococcoidia bacterium]
MLCTRIEAGMRYHEGVVEGCYIAKVFEVDFTRDWPTKRMKPLISLFGESEEDAADQVTLWLKSGRLIPTAAALT